MEKRNLLNLHISLRETDEVVTGMEIEVKKKTTALNVNSQKKRLLALIKQYLAHLNAVIDLHPPKSPSRQVIAAEMGRWLDISDKIKEMNPATAERTKAGLQALLSQAKEEIRIANEAVRDELKRAA